MFHVPHVPPLIPRVTPFGEGYKCEASHYGILFALIIQCSPLHPASKQPHCVFFLGKKRSWQCSREEIRCAHSRDMQWGWCVGSEVDVCCVQWGWCVLCVQWACCVLSVQWGWCVLCVCTVRLICVECLVRLMYVECAVSLMCAMWAVRLICAVCLQRGWCVLCVQWDWCVLCVCNEVDEWTVLKLVACTGALTYRNWSNPFFTFFVSVGITTRWTRFPSFHCHYWDVQTDTGFWRTVALLDLLMCHSKSTNSRGTVQHVWDDEPDRQAVYEYRDGSVVSGGKAPHISQIGTWCGWLLSFTLRPHYMLTNGPRYPLFVMLQIWLSNHVGSVPE